MQRLLRYEMVLLSSLLFYMIVVFTLQASAAAPESDHGDFVGRLVYAGVSGEKRTVQLTEPFAYRDPKGKLWSVPPGAKVNGASIPQVFWSVIGGPFTEGYREASVIHDFFCEFQTEKWEDTHSMFRSAMRANGVSSAKANAMYHAVYWFGPRWNKVSFEGETRTITYNPEMLDSRAVSILQDVAAGFICGSD